jgi:serine/threonine protein kinase
MCFWTRKTTRKLQVCVLHNRATTPPSLLVVVVVFVVVADFGLSEHRDKAQKVEETANIGTPVYMAPELMSEDAAVICDGAMVDVYAFGILMWAVFTRSKPYERTMVGKRLGVWELVSHML